MTSPPPSGSSSMDCRDNQLDELSSQPLFTPSASSVADPDSLHRVTIDSACPDSSASPPSPGQVSLHSTSNLGLLDKLKSRLGLNKKKVNSTDNNSSSSNNDISNGNMNEINIVIMTRVLPIRMEINKVIMESYIIVKKVILMIM